MANEQFANIVLRLLVDNKAFAEGLKTSLTLVGQMSTQVKQLTQFKIPAPDLGALDITVDLYNQKIGEIIAANEQLGAATKKLPAATAPAGAALGGLAQQSGNANLFLQQLSFTVQDTPFFFQNFRFGVQAVSNNIGFLIVQWQNLQKDLKAGQSTFSLLTQTLKGPAGVVVALSLVLGAVQALSILLGDLSQEAEDAAEGGIQKLVDTLNELPKQATKGIIAGLRSELEEVEANIKKLKAQRDLLREGDLRPGTDKAGRDALAAAVKELAAKEKIRDTLEETLDLYDKQVEAAGALDPIEKRRRDAIAAQGTEFLRLQLELEGINEELRTGVSLTSGLALGTEGLREIADRKEAIDKRIKELTSSTKAIEEERLKILEKELELEGKREAARRKAHQQQVDDNTAVLNIITDLEIEAIDDKFTRQRAQNEKEFNETLAQIDVLHADELDKAEARQLAREVFDRKNRDTNQQEVDEYTKAYLDSLKLIADEREKNEQEASTLRIQLAGGEQEQEIAEIQERFRVLREAARRQIRDEGTLRQAVNLLDRQEAAQIAAVRLRGVQQALGSAQNIMSNIVGIAAHLSPAGQAFVDQLRRALDIAVAIVTIISTIKTLTSFFGFGGGTPGQTINFGRGGFTGAGASSQPAGIVHAGEFVFEKPIVDRALPFLASVRNAFRSGNDLPGFESGGLVGPDGSLRLPAEVINNLFASVTGGGVSREEFGVLIDEVRRTNERLDFVARGIGDTTSAVDRIKLNLPPEITVKADGREIKKVIRLDDESLQ